MISERLIKLLNKKILIIANPSSGKAKMKTELMGVVQNLSNAGYEVTVYPTKERADATERVKKIAEDEFEMVVVCGGDGTLNEVITGLMQTKVSVKIGYIPAGTLNEWSQGLGISRNIQKASNEVVSGKAIGLDIGKFDDKYFTYTASFGAFTSASYDTPQELKNFFGQTAYLIGGIKSLANLKPNYMKFTINGEVIEGDFLFGAISNSMSVGGIVKFKENVVELNDGLFEVLLIRKPDNILKLQPIIDGLLKRDFSKDGIEFFHTDKIVVESKDCEPWTLDGEYCESKEKFVIENVHDAIKFVVPDIQ